MPKALVAPHAGYAYSGRAAAAALATPRDSAQRIAHVVLIGPAHYVHGA
jgi:AmmeMemoRadiSam system protein B